MKFLKIIAVSSLVLLKAGCAMTEPRGSLQSALLIETSAASVGALNTAISQALNGASVSVAQDAFTQSSELQIERMAQDPASMLGLNGRLMSRPEAHRFSLKSNNKGNCYLVYQRTGFEYRLDDVKCRVI